jgi:lysine/ornithine N-monooxygenase
VWEVDPSVDSALESAEDLGAGGGSRQTHVQVGPEGAWLSVFVLDAVVLAVGFRHSVVNFVQTKLDSNREKTKELNRFTIEDGLKILANPHFGNKPFVNVFYIKMLSPKCCFRPKIHPI